MNRRAFLLGSGLAATATVVRARPGARAAVGDLDFASAEAVARAIRRGDVSSFDVTSHAFERIKRYSPRLSAIVTLTEDSALARARAADEGRARGEWWGPLHGVPCTIWISFATLTGLPATTAPIGLTSDGLRDRPVPGGLHADRHRRKARRCGGRLPSSPGL